MAIEQSPEKTGGTRLYHATQSEDSALQSRRSAASHAKPKPSITLVPIGGLANRLRAILSTRMLAMQHNCDFKVVWPCNQSLNCPAQRLIRTDVLDFELTDKQGWAILPFTYPRKRNAFIPSLFQHLRYDSLIYEQNDSSAEEIHKGILHALLENRHKLLVMTGLEIYPIQPEIIQQYIQPSPEIAASIETTRQHHPKLSVGLHIRRTDNTISIAQSPLSLFKAKMQQHLQDNPDTIFYLATDSEQVKRELLHDFGPSIITQARPASRTTADGMIDAATELFLLAQLPYFYGSYYSSFSDLICALSSTETEENKHAGISASSAHHCEILHL